MHARSVSRRGFLHLTSCASAALFAASLAGRAGGRKPLHLSTNAYSWHVFYQREGRNFAASIETGLHDVVASGLNGFEPGAGGTEDVRRLLPLLRKHGLEMRSIYVNSTLHEPSEADRSINQILEVAQATRAFGTRILVTNPNPIRWGGNDYKNDDQLRCQAAALNRLGKALAAQKMVLAYHYHDIELRQAAREFHHMMVGTDPRLVTLCLDSHWAYRGSGNSSVALFDIIELYGDRISEIHLRQSQQGVWSEALGPGDIDHPALARALARKRVKPHLVLEIAVENGTPKTLDPVTAHRRSADYARQVFG